MYHVKKNILFKLKFQNFKMNFSKVPIGKIPLYITLHKYEYCERRRLWHLTSRLSHFNEIEKQFGDMMDS